MIKRIIDAGTQIIPKYLDGKIVSVNEISGGTKSYNIEYTFEMSDKNWKFFIENKTCEFTVENNNIIEINRTNNHKSIFEYDNDKLVNVTHINHPDKLYHEKIIWENDKMIQAIIKGEPEESEDILEIETREIVSSKIENSWKKIPNELKMLLFDKLGYLYFTTKYDFAEFIKYRILNDTIFSKYVMKFNYDNDGNILSMERHGSNGAKDRSDVIIEYY